MKLDDLKARLLNPPFADQIHMVDLHATAAQAITDLEALVGELEAAVVILRCEAVLLLSNSEGCSRNHYGDDCQTFGMPQWLIDSRRNIDQAFRAAEDATLAKLEKARGKDHEHG